RLRQIADVTAHLERIVEHVEARNARRARRGGHVAGEDAHGVGLARAIGPEKTKYFAFIYGERNVVNRRDRAIGLGQVLNFYQCVPPNLSINMTYSRPQGYTKNRENFTITSRR